MKIALSCLENPRDGEAWWAAVYGVAQSSRYADDTTLMAEREEELKSLLMKVKEESENVSLKLTFRELRSWHLVPSLHGKYMGK